MKKIYLLFSLLFAITWQAANAQAFLVSDAPSGGTWATKTYWYAIKNNNTNYLSTSVTQSQTINETATDVLYLNQTSLSGTDGAAADAEMWCVVGSETDGYQFYNKASGASKVLGTIILDTSNGGTDRVYMVNASTTSATSNNTNDIVTKYTRTSGTKYSYSEVIYLATDTKYWALNNRSSYLSTWQATTSVSWWGEASVTLNDGGSNFVFEPADDFTEAYRAAETALNTATVGVIFGPTQDAYNTLSEVLTTYKNADPTSDNVTALNDAVTAFNNSTASLSTTESTRVFLTNKLAANAGYYMRVKLNEAAIGSGTDKSVGNYLGRTNTKSSPSIVFTLIPTTTDGVTTYKIYSEYANMYVGSIPSAQNAEFTLVESAENAGSYTIENVEGTSYVCIYDATNSITNANYGALNALHMSSTWDGIVLWTKTADASQFILDASDDVEESLNTWYDAIKAEAQTITNLAGCTTIGYPNYSNTTDVSTALTTFTSEGKDYNYRTLETAIAAVSYTVNTPTTGHYYTIRNAQDNSYYVYEDYDNARPMSHTAQTNVVPGLWAFESVDAPSTYTNSNSYQFYHIQGANPIQNTDETSYISTFNYNNAPTMVSSADEAAYFIIMSPYTTGENCVKIDNSVSLRALYNSNSSIDATLSANMYGRAPSEGSTMGSYNGSGDVYNNWNIEEVTEIPVTVTSAGYATLCLPFAVTVPTSGSIGVYTAAHSTNSDGDDEISLTEIADGTTVPAQTPVVLVAEGGATETFAIDYDNTEPATTTALTGILAPEELASNSGKYILKNGEEGMGFYLVNSETSSKLSANRAYLSYTKSSSTNMLKFNLGDETTGINAIATDKAADVYYDLQGRRVLYPVHGVFVKGNGQKVYIK